MFKKQTKKIKDWFKDLSAQSAAAVKVIAGTPRALKLVWDADPWQTFTMITLNLLMGVFPLANLWLIKMITDEITGAASRTSPFQVNAFVANLFQMDKLFGNLFQVSLIHLLVWIAIIHVFEGVFSQLSSHVQSQLGETLSLKMNEQILRKVNSFPDMSLFESPKFYDALQKAEREAGYRPMNILHYGLAVLRSSVQFISMTGSILIFQPVLAALVILFSVPSMYMRIKHDNENYKSESWQTAEVRRMTYLQRVLTGDYYAKEIRMFGLGDYFLNSYLQKYKTYFGSRAKIRKKQNIQHLIMGSLSSLTQASCYGLIAVQAAAGAISLGTFTFYTSALAQLEGQLMSLIWSTSSLYEGNLYLNNLFEFMDMEPTMKLADPTWALDAPNPIKTGIEFKNVSFTYAGAEKPVFKNLNLRLNVGQCVALVGENGAGKTTIVKLLGRLYDPNEGEICVDGINLKELDLESWRKNIAVIFQNFNEYHMTSGENIGLGQVNFIDDEMRIRRAAGKGGATALIEDLPDGFNNMLGRYYEEDKGANLSGGEWQKVALSRAFMRSPDADEAGAENTAQILILDEPTASLDVQSEHDIFERFQKLTEDKTTLLISHRFSTVKMADRIILLEDGEIKEDGSHDELMALDGNYARLFKLQADKYL